MTDLSIEHLTPDDIKAVTRKLEQAVVEHSHWFTAWHRKLICRLPIAGDDSIEDAHHHCGFGQWYYSQAASALHDDPGFTAIQRIHQAMHDTARILGEKAKEGHTIAVEEYDAFIKLQAEFSQHARALRDRLIGTQYLFDPLTGVFGRQALLPILLHERARALRDKQQCSIAMVDLDHFKRINDNHGHPNGDKVLQAVALHFCENVRPYDSVFRYGGDEFLLCMPNTNLNIGQATLERLRSGLEALPIALNEKTVVYMTASFGLAVMGEDVPVEDSISRADEALYRAKTAGCNQVEVWTGTVKHSRRARNAD